MIHRIQYTGPALRDLRASERYIRAHGGDLVADRFIEAVVAKVSSLRHKPTRQRLRPELGVGVRAVATGNYLIFYRVAPDTVSIVRVVHGSRNITADLFAE